MGKVYTWYRNGRVHMKSYDPEGKRPLVMFSSNGLTKHFLYETYNNAWTLIYTSWILESKNIYHHDSEPARVNYFESGKIEEECYYRNGSLHRDGKPAVIKYTEDGEDFYKAYYKNGKMYRCIMHGEDKEIH